MILTYGTVPFLWHMVVIDMYRKQTHYQNNKCVSTYCKVPVVERLDFELWGCKGELSQNIVPKSILRFHMFLNLQYLIFKLLDGYGAKTVCSCKNGPLNCQNTNTLYRFPNFNSLFLS